MDLYLKEALGLPLGTLHKYLRENKIKLNGKKAPLSTRLAPGDEIRLYLPDEKRSVPAILYEDDRLVAVDKPQGLASGDNKQDTGDSALARVRQYLAGARAAGQGFHPSLCHRLDTGTGGVLLIAKTPGMLAFVEELMRGGKLGKTYLCVTVGHPTPPAGTLEGYLQKDPKKGLVRVSRAEMHGGRPITTHYETLATSGKLALLQVGLITGRTHQIRAHLAYVGAPILGDGKYGDYAANRALNLRRQCLCAFEVLFPTEPVSGFEAYAGLSIRCPEPWYVAQLREGVLTL